MIYIVETFTHGIEVCCTTECWIGVQVFRIVPQVWIIYQTFFVNQVFLVEHEVKTRKRWEQADIWVSDCITHQVTTSTQAFFKPIQTIKDTVEVVFVIFLTSY